MYLRNCWYQAAWSEDVAKGASMARLILNEPIVLWRGRDGRAAALSDRCPHRFAPLSAGRVQDGRLACGYHGLAFGRDGKCVANPHGPVTRGMNVRAYPVAERHSIIWIWPGDPERADETLIPDLSFIDETPGIAQIRAYLPTAANYQLIVDNIMDLSHIDYIHPETLGGMMTGSTSQARTEQDKVIAEWIATNARTPLAYKPMVPEGPCDIQIKVTWQAPALLVLDNAVTPTGTPAIEINHRMTLHSITPETDRTAHYFVCSARRFALDDEEMTARLRAGLMQAFANEDKPMLEMQQARMGTSDLWSLNPVLLKIDSGAIRARRKLDEQIVADEGKAPTSMQENAP